MSYHDVDSVVKAQRSTITTSPEKKAWVVQQLALLSELSPMHLSMLIDLRDPDIQTAFHKGRKKCFTMCQ
jgi:hypothetical protein